MRPLHARTCAGLDSLAPIGRNILSLRLGLGISATALASRCDLNRRSIERILKGGSCTLDTLRTIASVLDVHAWELLKPDHFPLTEDAQR